MSINLLVPSQLSASQTFLVDGDFEQGVAGQQLPEVDFGRHLMLYGRQGCSELKI